VKRKKKKKDKTRPTSGRKEHNRQTGRLVPCSGGQGESRNPTLKTQRDHRGGFGEKGRGEDVFQGRCGMGGAMGRGEPTRVEDAKGLQHPQKAASGKARTDRRKEETSEYPRQRSVVEGEIFKCFNLLCVVKFSERERSRGKRFRVGFRGEGIKDSGGGGRRVSRSPEKDRSRYRFRRSLFHCAQRRGPGNTAAQGFQGRENVTGPER